MLGAGRITGKTAKQCMDMVIAEDREPEDIVKEKGWEQLTDPAQIAAAAQGVLAAEESTVAELRELAAAPEGKEKRRRTLTATSWERLSPPQAGGPIRSLPGNRSKRCWDNPTDFFR